MLQKQTDSEYPKRPPTWGLGGREQLQPYERAVVVMTHNVSDAYTRFVQVNSTHPVAEVEVLPGDYHIESYLIKDLNASGTPLIIPATTLCADGFGAVPGCQNEVNLPAIEFNTSAPLGGLRFDETVGISRTDLQGSSTMRFMLAAVSPSSLTNHVDLEVFNQFANVTQENRNSFLPTFS
jgi:hypothetical protein